MLLPSNQETTGRRLMTSGCGKHANGNRPAGNRQIALENTFEPYPVMLTSRYMEGVGVPVRRVAQRLKDEYTYNPRLARALLT